MTFTIFGLTFGRKPTPAAVVDVKAIVDTVVTLEYAFNKAETALRTQQKDIKDDYDGFWAGIEAIFVPLRPLFADQPDILDLMKAEDVPPDNISTFFGRWNVMEGKALKEAHQAKAMADYPAERKAWARFHLACAMTELRASPGVAPALQFFQAFKYDMRAAVAA